MTRKEAIRKVSERWENLDLDKTAAPVMFSVDVDAMVAESKPKYLCPECDLPVDMQDALCGECIDKVG